MARGPGIAEVAAHNVTPLFCQLLAQSIGPGQHRRGAEAENQRRIRLTELVDAEAHSIDVADTHSAPPPA
ncbi:hypothetical protein [Brevibacterium permense]|uniref:Uncharacterized protein n=1 Tax=Brevibacterium permense TaxID=234834 RepID=A0ABN2AQI1_9MICO|nr:hypothetical protein [Brevibacterium permense]